MGERRVVHTKSSSDFPMFPPLALAISVTCTLPSAAFGMIQSSDGAMMQRFGVEKVPFIVVMFPAGEPGGVKSCMKQSKAHWLVCLLHVCSVYVDRSYRCR